MKRSFLIFALFTAVSSAFAQSDDYQTNSKAGCLDVPLTLTSQPQEITNTASTNISTSKVFVYYHDRKRRHWKSETWNANGEIPDNHPSRPLLLSRIDKTTLVPQTYKITVVSPDDRVKVCKDQQAQVPANINIEKTSEFTGNYPNANNSEYKKVSKHVYKRTCRIVKRIDRKERQVSRGTNMHVNA